MPHHTIENASKADRQKAIHPTTTALLSVDMQNSEWSPDRAEAARGNSEAYFLNRLTDVVIPNQQRLQTAARAAGIEVMYTTIEALTLDGRDISLDHKISGIFVPKGHHDAKPIDAIGPVGDEIVIPKTASGLFNCTNIEYVLRNLGITQLVIYGICTDQCVETAVRDACDRGFLVTLVPDCCAAGDPVREANAIAALDDHYARCRSTEALLAEFSAVSVGTAA